VSHWSSIFTGTAMAPYDYEIPISNSWIRTYCTISHSAADPTIWLRCSVTSR